MIPVKICGITRYEDAKLSIELGAWALGFVFYRKSPRYIDPDAVQEIINKLKQDGLAAKEYVGVFVNPSSKELNNIFGKADLTICQLHGAESPDFCHQLPWNVIKAFRLENDADVVECEKWGNLGWFLTDAAKKGEWGGTGELSDWDLSGKLKLNSLNVPLLLSGGINIENIYEASQKISPWGFDLSSGVEDAPGIKSAEKLKSLFQLVRKIDYENA